MENPPPVLLVHGLFGSAAVMKPMADRLRARRPVESLDLRPSDGSVPIAELGRRIDTAAARFAALYRSTDVDLVGFSMGALACRWVVQRGETPIRRFVSISGPHMGTATALFLNRAGIRDMRPGSPLLTELAADPDPWKSTRVFSFRTPFDLLIVPSTSSKLPQSRERTFAVPLHRWMPGDPRVTGAVAEALDD